MDTKTDTNKSGLILSKERLSHWLTSIGSERQQSSVELSSKQRELYKNYPDPTRLLVEYNPSIQLEIIRHGVSFAELSENSDIPTLGLLRSVYGVETPFEFLRIHIGSLNDYAEQGKGISSEQLSDLINLIIGEYYYLNIAEIAFFIARFKLGKYGEFYGAIGPMKIATALSEYVKERNTDIDRYERKKREKQENEMREIRKNTAITRLEYERWKAECNEKNT